MDELLKEQLETTPKIRDRKIDRSMTPETRDLIKLVLESRTFFDEKEDFSEEEDMSLDPVIQAKFSAKTVSTSKSFSFKKVFHFKNRWLRGREDTSVTRTYKSRSRGSQPPHHLVLKKNRLNDGTAYSM